MSDEMRHPSEDLQALVDGRLSHERQAAVRAHVAECARCREELARAEWVKAMARRLAAPASASAPVEIEQAVRAALDDADPDRARASWWRPLRVSRMGLGAAAAVVALLAVLVGVWLRAPSGAPEDVAAHFVAYREGELTAERVTGDADALGRYFQERGIAYRVIDLAMMEYTLLGGRVHAVRGQPSTVAFYQGADGERVLCEMYEGRLPSEPPAEVRHHEGIEFSIYRVGDVTVVFWPEGDVVCILASDIDPEALIQLAFEKAMLAT